MATKHSELPKKMKAMRVTQFGKSLECQEVDVPKPCCAGEVLVKVNMCGICHTDLHMRNGDLSFQPDLPLTLGHEGVGKVVKVGPGVHRLKVGDRVICGVVGDCCGSCADCLDGCETACMKVKLNGCNSDGHLAEYFKLKESFACLIPDNVSDEEAAPINCAGVTCYKALKVTQLWCGQWLVIVGAAGGLGYYCVQYAKAMGLKIIAIEKGKDKIDFLKQFKDIHCLDCDKDDIVQQIKKLTGKGANAAIILAPTSEVFEQAPTYLRKRGRIVVVGQHPASERVEYDMTSLVVNCNTVVGSLAGTRCDLREAMKLLGDGLIKSSGTTVRDFKEVNDILDELKGGKVTGRMVVKMPASEE